jgi:RHS repeat-associated protein
VDTITSFYPTFDGNGNVTEYLKWVQDSDPVTPGDQSDAIVAAHFEYDAFGNLVVDTYSKASLFPFRFSTKPQDSVTGLYYYGYRWYDPLTGRWPSRDPIGEGGGLNLYGFVGNDGVSYVDLVGMSEFPPTLVNKADQVIESMDEAKEVLGIDPKSKQLNKSGMHSLEAECSYRSELKTIGGEEKCCIIYMGFVYSSKITRISNKVVKEILGLGIEDVFKQWTKNEIDQRELSNADFYHGRGRIRVLTAGGIKRHEERHRAQYFSVITPALLKMQDQAFEKESEEEYNNSGKCWSSPDTAAIVLKGARERNPRTMELIRAAMHTRFAVTKEQLDAGFAERDWGEDDAVSAERKYYESIRGRVAQGGNLSEL